MSLSGSPKKLASRARGPILMKKDDSIRQLGIWESLKQATRVHLPGIVVEEARYYIDDYRKWGLDLQAQADSSEIEVLSATLEQMRSVIRDFVPAFSEAIHDGEREALAILCAGAVPDLVFCTGDINAMQAAGMLAIDQSLISLEKLIELLKLRPATRLVASLSQATLHHHCSIGRQRRISREYFKV
jgi:hypothetical protein